MSIRILPRAGISVSGATAVEIDHTNDSISLGDGTNLLEFLDPLSNGTWALPVQPIGGGDASAANQTSGDQKTQITDGSKTDVAEIDDVGGEKALKVSVIASVGGGGGGTAATDEASFTAGATQFTGIGGVYNDSVSDLSSGEMGMARLTDKRALHTHITNSSIAVTGTFWQATQPVSGTVAATQSGTWNIGSITTLPTISLGASSNNIGDVDVLSLPSIPAGTNNIGKVDVNALPSIPAGSNTIGKVQVDGSVAVTGTFWQATQPVSLASVPTHAVTQSGTWNIGSISSLPTISLGASSNNIGDVDVLSLPSLPAGSNTIGNVGLTGSNNIVTPYQTRTNVVKGAITLSNTASTSIIAAQGSGNYVDLVQLVLTNTSSTAVRVDVRDAGTGGSVIFSVALAANGGAVIPFPATLPQTTANQAWALQLSAAVTDVRCLAIGVVRT